MPKTNPTVRLEDYAPVADRIELFYRDHPTGRITTKLVAREGREIIVKAFAYRNADDTLPAATGYAAEREGDGEVNAVACLENTETSAIGRALANLGFTASKKRPSREEMARVQRAPIHPTQPSTPAKLPSEDPLVTDFAMMLKRAERAGFSPRRSRVIRESVVRYRAGAIPAARLSKVESSVRHWLRRKSV